MARRLVGFSVLIWISACGQESRHHPTPRPATGQKPPSFSAWSCDEAQSHSLFMNGEDDANVPHWLALAASEVGKQNLQARVWRFRPTEKASLSTLRFYRDNIPLCRLYGRADKIGDRTFTHLPAQDVAAYRSADAAWDAAEKSAESLANALLASVDAGSIEASRCWWDSDGKLWPAWAIKAKSSIGPVQGFANGSKVYSASEQALDLDGTARVYENNINGALVDVPLYGLDGSGYLRGPRFASVGVQPMAKSDDGQFNTPSNDSTFVEISAYANAERVSAWLEQKSPHRSFGCVPIEIHTHFVFKYGNINNATYKADSGNGVPGIFLGDGDGINLQNIGTDVDAIGHEVGHHVIYRSVTDVDDDSSVVIHEGLADFFVYARTGDPCLGESLCPFGSDACWVRDQCLRTAENSLKLTDSDLPGEPHQRSQVISGMLWDISGDVGMAVITDVTFRAIDYLFPRSTLRDLITALMLADHELNGGQNACLIFNKALGRGFGEHLSGLKCSDYEKH